MNIQEQLQNISFLHFAELIAFALVILFTLKYRNINPRMIWAVANLMSAVAIIYPSVLVETESSSQYNIYGFILSTLALILTYFALASGQRKIVHFHKSLPIFGIAVVGMLISTLPSYGWLASVIGYSSGGIVVFATAWVCLKNRYWRGLWGQSLLVVGLCICALILLWRGWVVFDGREGVGFSVDPAKSLLGLQLLVATSFFMQLGFFAMVGGRESRSRRFAGRRAARLFEISVEMEQEQKRLAVIADVRLYTLDLLTHEVRQPINNAQAALEALNDEIKPDGPDAAHFKKTIRRAQSVLDSINLSVSNAIVGVPLLDDQHAVTTRSVNAYDVAELAKFDCPIDLAHRIKSGSVDAPVYVDIDPILVRLALRNLLDNALKYSPASTEIQLDIIQREDRLGTSFTVTNQLHGPDLLNGDIFMQGVRGSGTQAEGSGLGLFLVRKVAETHHGTVSYTVHDQKTVTFDLFIPD